MKKLLLTLLMGLMAFSLAACNGDEAKEKDTSKSEETPEEAPKEEQAAIDPEEMQKKLDAQKVKDDRIVAIVNGQEIKGSEYNVALNTIQSNALQQGQDLANEESTKLLKENTLNFLIGQTLIMQEVDKKGYTASEEDINKGLETEKSRFENDKAFEQALKDSNLTLDELKKQISDGVKISQYLEKDLKVEEVKEEEVRKLYDSLANSAGESAETPKYEDVKETLKAQLEQQKTQKEISSKIEELREAAKIELKI